MPHFFCPSCWHEISEGQDECPECHVSITERWDKKDFVDKLIAALKHPEPTTPIRAAMILGKLKDTRAISHLIFIAQTAHDIFIILAAVRALREFESPVAHNFLMTLKNHPASLIRNEINEYAHSMDT